MVGTIGTEIQKDRTQPVFVPPRKRQTNKKLNCTQNYVDHIVSIQVFIYIYLNTLTLIPF